MAELDLEAIEARANAATPGPWMTGMMTAGGMVNDDAFKKYFAAWVQIGDKSIVNVLSENLEAQEGACKYCNKGVLVQKSTGKIVPRHSNVAFELNYHTHLVPCKGGNQAYGPDGKVILQDDDYDTDPNYTNNSAFVSHARTDVPALIAEVRRLRALTGKLGCWYHQNGYGDESSCTCPKRAAD